ENSLEVLSGSVLEVGVVRVDLRAALRAAVLLDVAVGGDHVALDLLGLVLPLALLLAGQPLAAEELFDDGVDEPRADGLLGALDAVEGLQAPAGILLHDGA